MSPADKEDAKKSRRLRWILGWAVKFAAAAAIAYAILIYVVPFLAPLPKELSRPQDSSTVITDSDGRTLRRLLVNGREVVAAYAKLPEIPENLINATVAAEDKRFWEHNGIDYFAILRATHDLVRHQKQVSGASTITQQLVKLTSEPRPRTIKTKLYEMLCARRLEMKRDKDWIFENYINRLPYGNMRTGCRAAARGYFDKPLADLSLAECALLAALPNKPTRFNPYKNFQGARERQLWILDRMLEDGYITEQQWTRARNERLVIVHGHMAFESPHAVELILSEHREHLKPGEVRTTIDSRLQTFAAQAIDRQIDLIAAQRHTSPFLHAAVVVIENETGNVLVLNGSRDYFDSHGGQINGAWVPRSPGSALKPFTYLLTLERGHSAASILPDIPTSFMTSTGVYRPVNYDRTYRGPIRMREALGNSLNIPAVRLLEELGGPEPLQETLTKLGLTTLTENPGKYGLGLTIGSAEVRLLELTNAYACLARLGQWKPYRLLATQPESQTTRLFSEDSSYLIADMLSDPAARALTFGWNNPLRFDFQVAAKTGTSSDYRDAWTLGFTPEYTVGVWLGNFDNSPLDHFSGAAGAGPILHEIMEKLHETQKSTWYSRPDNIVAIQIDPATGKRATTGFRPKNLDTELVRSSHSPPPATPADYNAEGQALLPEIYAEWLQDASQPIQSQLALESGSTQPDFQITSPLPGMTIFLDPDLNNSGRILPLSTTRSRPVQWSSATLLIDTARPAAILTPGDHELVAEDPETGQREIVTFRVEGL